MHIFGYDITRREKSAPNGALITNLPTAANGWLARVREPFAGAWQRNVSVNPQTVLTNSTVFACIKRIAEDVSKLWVKLVEEDDNGIVTEINRNSPFLPVLRKPNHFQTRVKFFEYWLISKLTTGNTYVFKARDNRGIVTDLYVLDPYRVQVLMSSDGSVYYALGQDYLSGITSASTVVPESEIIHDVAMTPFHPLCGVSPIFACGLAATQGLNILNNSALLFAKGSSLSGVLTAPAAISPETAKRIEENWEANFSGPDNVGKTAVLGDGLHFEPMVMTAVDAQLIEQLKMSAEMVCSAFSMPPYMVGLGSAPVNTNPQAITLMYYQTALQNPIENIEELLTEGLSLPTGMSVEFDLDALMRMDSLTLMNVMAEGVKAGFVMPDEARAKFDYKPVPGGNTPYMQEQNWPLKLLEGRQLPTRPITPPADMTPPPAATSTSQAASKRYTFGCGCGISCECQDGARQWCSAACERCEVDCECQQRLEIDADDVTRELEVAVTT